jgi:hypothetical protein
VVGLWNKTSVSDDLASVRSVGWKLDSKIVAGGAEARKGAEGRKDKTQVRELTQKEGQRPPPRTEGKVEGHAGSLENGMRVWTWGRETENGVRKRRAGQGKIAHAHKRSGEEVNQDSRSQKAEGVQQNPGCLTPRLANACPITNGKGGCRMFGMSDLLPTPDVRGDRAWPCALGHFAGRQEPDWPARRSGSKRRGRSN